MLLRTFCNQQLSAQKETSQIQFSTTMTLVETTSSCFPLNWPTKTEYKESHFLTQFYIRVGDDQLFLKSHFVQETDEPIWATDLGASQNWRL